MLDGRAGARLGRALERDARRNDATFIGRTEASGGRGCVDDAYVRDLVRLGRVAAACGGEDEWNEQGSAECKTDSVRHGPTSFSLTVNTGDRHQSHDASLLR